MLIISPIAINKIWYLIGIPKNALHFLLQSVFLLLCWIITTEFYFIHMALSSKLTFIKNFIHSKLNHFIVIIPPVEPSSWWYGWGFGTVPVVTGSGEIEPCWQKLLHHPVSVTKV